MSVLTKKCLFYAFTFPQIQHLWGGMRISVEEIILKRWKTKNNEWRLSSAKNETKLYKLVGRNVKILKSNTLLYVQLIALIAANTTSSIAGLLRHINWIIWKKSSDIVSSWMTNHQEILDGRLEEVKQKQKTNLKKEWQTTSVFLHKKTPTWDVPVVSTSWANTKL